MASLGLRVARYKWCCSYVFSKIDTDGSGAVTLRELVSAVLVRDGYLPETKCKGPGALGAMKLSGDDAEDIQQIAQQCAVTRGSRRVRCAHWNTPSGAATASAAAVAGGAVVAGDALRIGLHLTLALGKKWAADVAQDEPAIVNGTTGAAGAAGGTAKQRAQLMGVVLDVPYPFESNDDLFLYRYRFHDGSPSARVQEAGCDGALPPCCGARGTR